MLDGMRRHKGWLKWSLALVVLAFMFLYVPGFVDETALEGMPNEVLARVGEHEITVARFRQIYLAQLQSYRLQSSGEVTEEVLRSLGVDRQILQALISRYAALSEAERLGLTVSDAEVRQRIVSLPGFQENGQFVGEQRYRQALQFQRPPMTPAQFEEEVRSDILFERLEAAVTGWVTVSDEEIAAEYRRRNEKVMVEIVAFRGDDYRDEVEASDGEIQALYDGIAPGVRGAGEAAAAVPARRRVGHLRNPRAYGCGGPAVLTTPTSPSTRRPGRCAPATSSCAPGSRTRARWRPGPGSWETRRARGPTSRSWRASTRRTRRPPPKAAISGCSDAAAWWPRSRPPPSDSTSTPSRIPSAARSASTSSA